jgi:Uncharacterized conserved protein
MRKRDLNIWKLCTAVLLICMGVCAWLQPLGSLLFFAFYLGIAFAVCGAAKLLFVVTRRVYGWLAVLGLIDIFIGIVFLTDIHVTKVTLPVIFAFWTLLSGIVRITMGYQYFTGDQSRWKWEIGSGVVGALFAGLILIHPVVGSLYLAILFGMTLVSYGICDICGDLLERNEEREVYSFKKLNRN